MDQNQKQYKNIEEIRKRADEIKDKTFRELKKTISIDKGDAGKLVERWFGLSNDNSSKADFSKLGVELELKTTPIKKLKNNKYSAKERLVLGKINYNSYGNDHEEKSFSNSHIFGKIKNTLIINYLHDFTDVLASKFLDNWLMSFSEEEMKIIEIDYEIIVNKIKAGQAHLISGKDTTYLEACTKGAGHGETTIQPFSEIPASPRAFALKSGFMTRRTREIYGQILPDVVSREVLLNKVKSKFDKYIGMTANEILLSLNRKPQNGKSAHANAIKWLLNSMELSADDFEQISVVFKTQKMNKKGKIQESMSFSQINFADIKTTEFRDTDIFEALDNGIFLNIFSNDNVYMGSKMLEFTNEKIAIAESVYNDFKDSFRTKNEFLPNLKLNKVIHIRNKDLNSKIKIVEIAGKKYPKMAWWINREELL